jgi:hypothetical protein
MGAQLKMTGWRPARGASATAEIGRPRQRQQIEASAISNRNTRSTRNEVEVKNARSNRRLMVLPPGHRRVALTDPNITFSMGWSPANARSFSWFSNSMSASIANEAA